MKIPPTLRASAKAASPIVFIALVGLLIRAYFANKYGLWNDEIGAIRTVVYSNSFLDYLSNGLFADAVPPLYNVFGYFTVNLSANRDLGFRIPSLLFSTMTVLSMAGLCYKTSGYSCSVFAALFAAFGPAAIRYGYDARPYAMEVFFISVFWLLLEIIKEAKESSALVSILCLLALQFTCISHYFALIPAGILVFFYVLLPLKQHWKDSSNQHLPFAVASVIIYCYTAIFQLWLIRRQNIARNEFFNDYSPEFIWSYFSMIWQSDVIHAETTTVQGVKALPIALLVLLLFGIVRTRRRSQLWLASLTMVLIGVFFVPLLALLTRNILSVRFSLFALPALLLLTAHGTDFLFGIVKRSFQIRTFARISAAILSVGLLAISLQVLAKDAIIFFKNPYFQEWREKAAILDSVTAADHSIPAFSNNSIATRNINYYSKREINIWPPKTNLSGQEFYCSDISGQQVKQYLSDYKLAHNIISISGVVPAMLHVVPDSISGDVLRAKSLSDFVIAHRHVVPERRSWLYPQIASIVKDTGLDAASELIWQISYLEADSDYTRGYALLKLGAPDAAVAYMSEHISTTRQDLVKDYMITAYEQAKNSVEQQNESAVEPYKLIELAGRIPAGSIFITPSISANQSPKSTAHVVLTGSDFVNNQFTTSALVGTNTLNLSHFGAVESNFQITNSTSHLTISCSTDEKPYPYPVIKATITKLTSPTKDIKAFKDIPIRTSEPITKMLELVPGHYRISIGYHKSSDMAKRPTLHIHWIAFK